MNFSFFGQLIFLFRCLVGKFKSQRKVKFLLRVLCIQVFASRVVYTNNFNQRNDLIKDLRVFQLISVFQLDGVFVSEMRCFSMP